MHWQQFDIYHCECTNSGGSLPYCVFMAASLNMPLEEFLKKCDPTGLAATSGDFLRGCMTALQNDEVLLLVTFVLCTFLRLLWQVTTPMGLLLVDVQQLQEVTKPLSGGRKGCIQAAIDQALILKKEV